MSETTRTEPREHDWHRVGFDIEWHEPLYECSRCHKRTISAGSHMKGACNG
jgi:hypothetical protein